MSWPPSSPRSTGGGASCSGPGRTRPRGRGGRRRARHDRGGRRGAAQPPPERRRPLHGAGGTARSSSPGPRSGIGRRGRRGGRGAGAGPGGGRGGRSSTARKAPAATSRPRAADEAPDGEPARGAAGVGRSAHRGAREAPGRLGPTEVHHVADVLSQLARPPGRRAGAVPGGAGARRPAGGPRC